MRPRADRPVNKSCEVTVPGSPGRGNGENRPSGQPAADNRSGPAVSRKPESDRLLAGAWYSELGGLNRWCHIWAYKDAAERFAVRERARNEGGWPPRGGQPGVTLKQENMLVVPASFSPLH